MGAPLMYQGNMDLWVGNGIKDLFCELVAEQSKLEGRDISAIFENEPAIAGCYGIGGMQIDMEAFFPYFDGKDGFIDHLTMCRNNVSNLCKDEGVSKRMESVFEWVQHVLKGGRIPDKLNIYEKRP